MSAPETLASLIISLRRHPRYRRNYLALTQAINRHTTPTQGKAQTVERPAAIVAKETAAKEAVIDAAIALGTPFKDRDQVWTALLNLSGAGFITRAKQLVEAAPNETERLRRVEAAATIQALFLAAQAAEAQGAKSYRDPAFGEATETVTITNRRRWIDEYNNGQRVTPERVAEILAGGS